MIRLISRHRKIFLILIDIAAISVSFILAFLLRFDFNIPSDYFSILILWLPVFIGIQLISFNIFGFYAVIWRFTSVWEMLNIIKAVSISNLLGFVILGFYQGISGYPRSVLIIYFMLNIGTICSSRLMVRLYFSHIKGAVVNRTRQRKRLILVGAGKSGEKILREILSNPESKYKVVGFVDDNLEIRGSSLHGLRILGTTRDLPNLSAKYDEIIITAPSATGDQMRAIVKSCEQTGKRYKTVPSLNELIDKELSIASVRDVSYADLLGREEVKLDMNSIEQMLHGKRVLVTGAGGSIGSELVNQCLAFSPAEIVCLDINEEKIFHFTLKAQKQETPTKILPVLANIKNKNELKKVFNEYRPQIIFHAAAYKHVPIQEIQPWNAINTNVLGTLNLVELASLFRIKKFVLVSTDKAVNPTNVMGATKRVAEKIIQSINVASDTQFMAVRFGNVLGSSGSAIPIFEKQIKEGGPVTITHPDMTRYFMSIQEASQLILQSGALGSNGEIFLLEMGQPIKIDRMARDLIRLSGFVPDQEISIVYTGLRPGEKLYEELQSQEENVVKTSHKKIMILRGVDNRILPWDEFQPMVNELIGIAESMDSDKIQLSLKQLIPFYQPRAFASKQTEESTTTYPIQGEA